MSISNYLEDSILDLVFRNQSFSVTGVYIKLHDGDPGEDGTSNAATETTREQATFGSAASGGIITNTTDTTWTDVAGTETYTHISLWDASTGGNCLWVGAMTAPASVLATQEFEIASGALSITLD